MTSFCSVALALVAGSTLAVASSYQCGSAGAPGGYTTTAFECLVPGQAFRRPRRRRHIVPHNQFTEGHRSSMVPGRLAHRLREFVARDRCFLIARQGLQPKRQAMR